MSKRLLKCQYPNHIITFDSDKGLAGHRDVVKLLKLKLILPGPIQARIKELLKIGLARLGDSYLKRNAKAK